MTTGYVPIVIMALLAGAFGVLSLAASALLRPRRAMAPKAAPYESGITPQQLPGAQRFPVKFYVVAMLFIIFDIEVIFLFPWAVAFRSLGLFGLVEMLVFIGLVFVAYLYVWQKGGLEWETPERERPTSEEAEAGRERLPAAVELGPGETPRDIGAQPAARSSGATAASRAEERVGPRGG